MSTSVFNWLGENVPPLSLWLFAVGAFLLCLALLPYLFRWFRMRFAKKEALSSETQPQYATSTQPSAFQFYSTRPSFAEFRARLGDARSIWAAWLVGGTASQNNPFAAGHFDRVVLLNPIGKTVEAIAKSMGKELHELTGPIEALKRDAVNRKIPLRLYDGLSYSLITIGDPASDSGWAIVEPFLVGIEADQRCGFIVRRKDNPELFKKAYDSFLAIWDAGIPYD